MFEVGGGGGKGGGRAQREAIVGSGGKALRPLGMGTTFHPDKFPLCLGYLDSSPLSSLLYLKLFRCSVRHLRKMEVRPRSLKPPPKSSPDLTGPKFRWKRGVHWHCWRVRLRDYLPRYFPFEPLSLLFCLVLYPSVLALDHIQTTWSSCFF